MIQSRTMSKAIYIIMLFTGLLFVTSCSEENPDDPQSGTGIVEITIKSRGLNSTTRADGTPVDPDENEKIKDWWLVFVSRDNKVAKILKRKDQETGIGESEGAVEEETFRCVLPAGNYTVYAFVNISEKDLKKATGITESDQPLFSVGADVPEEIESYRWSTGLNLWDKTENIPMTGKLDVKVQNTIEERFSIEVVRMVAKIQFEFTNPTSEDVTVTSVSINPVTSSAITLFPDYDALGEKSYTPLDEATYTELKYEPGKDNIVKAKNDDKDGKNEDIWFYCQETVSNNDKDKGFIVGVELSRGTNRDYVQYSVTKDIKGYINRNDWIVIPITLSEYVVKVDALFYPPIGGYPAIMKTTDENSDYHFIFGTQGEFAITPMVYRLTKDGDVALQPAEYTVSIDDKQYRLNDNDEWKTGYPAGFFTKEPSFTTDDGRKVTEILGEIGDIEGTVRIAIKVEIGNQAYNRFLYIHRDND